MTTTATNIISATVIDESISTATPLTPDAPAPTSPKSAQSMHADALIIGFGKGGKTLAAKLGAQGKHVIVAEQNNQMYGGTCINIGCLPSKSLILDAERAQFSGESSDPDKRKQAYSNAIANKRQLTAMLRSKNYHKLADQEHITVLDGHAHFLSASEVQVDTAQGPVVVNADKIFINTGATARIPDIEGINTTPGVYTSTGMMEVDEIPERLVILGAGYIGLEFASMYADFGSQVTVLQHNNSFLPNEDEDIRQAIHQSLEAQGITFITNAHTHRVSQAADGHGVLLEVAVDNADTASANTASADNSTDNTITHIQADAVLIATGRVPNTEGLDAQKAGIALTDRGAVQVDDLLRTTAPNIWALGDVNGGPQHTYISLDDYRIVLSQLDEREAPYTRKDRKNIASVTFLHTPYARVGLNEQEAIAAGFDFEVKKMPTAAVPKAQVMRHTEGMMKALVERGTHRILGAMLFAAQSHEVINIVKLAMDLQAPATQLRDMVFTHPTMAEALNDLFA